MDCLSNDFLAARRPSFKTKIFKWEKKSYCCWCSNARPIMSRPRYSWYSCIHALVIFIMSDHHLLGRFISSNQLQQTFFSFFSGLVWSVKFWQENLILIAVSGLPKFYTIFHFPPSVRPSQLFSIIWWFRPWKPYIFQMHII